MPACCTCLPSLLTIRTYFVGLGQLPPPPLVFVCFGLVWAGTYNPPTHPSPRHPPRSPAPPGVLAPGTGYVVQQAGWYSRRFWNVIWPLCGEEGVCACVCVCVCEGGVATIGTEKCSEIDSRRRGRGVRRCLDARRQGVRAALG